MSDFIVGAIERQLIDSYAGKTTVLSYHRLLINTGVEKRNI
jgi:hypothetical protein